MDCQCPHPQAENVCLKQHCNCNHANRKWSGMTKKQKMFKHTNEKSLEPKMENRKQRRSLQKQSEQVTLTNTLMEKVRQTCCRVSFHHGVSDMEYIGAILIGHVSFDKIWRAWGSPVSYRLRSFWTHLISILSIVRSSGSRQVSAESSLFRVKKVSTYSLRWGFSQCEEQACSTPPYLPR